MNLVLVAEGEEEIGSPHFPQIVRRPEVLAALRKCSGVYMPSAEQDLDGKVTMTLGAKGVVELELVSSGEAGPGPAQGRPLQHQGHARQSGLAPGGSPGDAGFAGRQYSGD